jgi:hypothetical protein
MTGNTQKNRPVSENYGVAVVEYCKTRTLVFIGGKWL